MPTVENMDSAQAETPPGIVLANGSPGKVIIPPDEVATQQQDVPSLPPSPLPCPPVHCAEEEKTHCPPKEEPPMSLREFRNKRKGFGLAEAILFGGAIAGGIAMSSFLLTLGAPAALVLGIDAGLALLGSIGLMRHNNKQTLNEYHAYRAYSKREGYHHEPEFTQDRSLMHAIEGASDLPERKKYIEDNYGVKVPSKEQYRDRHLPLGLLKGTAVGLAVGAVVVGVFGPAALALGVLLGTLTGAVTLGKHSAKTMQEYGSYLDGVAQEEQAKADARSKDKCREVEYDNCKSRGQSYAADVAASRQEQAAGAAR
jgi:hypothetical protein